MKKFLLFIFLLPCFARAQQTYFTPGIPTGSTSFTPTFRYNSTDSLASYYLNNANRWSQVYTATQANNIFAPLGDYYTGLVTTIVSTNAVTTAGNWYINGTHYSKGTTTTTAISSVTSGLEREDIIYATTSNTILLQSGVAGVSFTEPTLPANTLAVAYVFTTSSGTTTSPSTKTPVYTTGNQTINGHKTSKGQTTFDNLVFFDKSPFIRPGNLPHFSLKGDTVVQDTTVYASLDYVNHHSGGSTPTNGLQVISPDSIGLGGSLTQDTQIITGGHAFTIIADPTTGNGPFIGASNGIAEMYSAGNLNVGDLQLDSAFSGFTHSTPAGIQQLSLSDVTGMLVTDNINLKGLEYQSDYSANFTDRSLVDKGYVDSLFASGGGGGTTTHPLTINNSGTGVSSGGTFDGSSAVTISYNSIGAQVAGSYAVLNGSNTFTGGFTSQYNGGSTYPYTSINNVAVTNTTASGTAVTLQSNALSWVTGGFVGSLVMTPTANRTITLPDATTTLLGTNNTATVTNKDLTSGTNTFPTFNQNTTGTAANLSGTPALPNGTTATTQTTGDNTTKIATDAFVNASISAIATPTLQTVAAAGNTSTVGLKAVSYLGWHSPYKAYPYTVSDPNDTVTFAIQSTRLWKHNLIMGILADTALTLVPSPSGEYNVVIGDGAAQHNQTGRDLIAIGYNSLNSYTNYSAAGSAEKGLHIGIGVLAFQALTKGLNGVAIGEDAAYKAVRVDDSEIIGNHEGGALDSIKNSILIGKAGFDGTVHSATSKVVALGDLIGTSLTTGVDTSDVFLGYGVAAQNMGLTDDVYIGTFSGYSATGKNNIFLGSGAGSTSTCSSCIILGSDPSVAVGETVNNTFTARHIRDVYFGEGRQGTSAPTGYTIHADGALGANSAGGVLTLAGGAGTGNAVAPITGGIKFALPLLTTTGSAAQSLINNFAYTSSQTSDAVNASATMNFNTTLSGDNSGYLRNIITAFTSNTNFTSDFIFSNKNGTSPASETMRILSTGGIKTVTGLFSGNVTALTYTSTQAGKGVNQFTGGLDIGGTGTAFDLDVTGRSNASAGVVSGTFSGLFTIGGGQGVLQSYHGIQLSGVTASSSQTYTAAGVGIGADAYHVVVPMTNTSAAGLAILGVTSQTANFFEATSAAQKTTAHGDIASLSAAGVWKSKGEILTALSAGSSTDSVLTKNPTTNVVGAVPVSNFVTASTHFHGNVTLVAGVATVSISGLTTSSTAVASLISTGGTFSTTVRLQVACTSNTITITAITGAGVVDTTDTSTIGYIADK